MIDFVIGLLHGLAFVFLLYGAYLATSWAFEGRREPHAERRQRARRKTDRRKDLRRDLYGLPR